MALTPAELLEKALGGESLDGEDATTEATEGDGSAEAVAADAAKPDEKAEDDAGKQAKDAGEEPDGAPIASKSGAYTIPYEKLTEARDQAKSLLGENEQLKQQLADLTAKQQANLVQQADSAQARADAGQTQTQADRNLEAAQAAMGQGVDASVFGDFSEEALAKGIKSLLVQEREAIRAELKAELEREFAPVKAKQAQEASDVHVSTILAKHPDANEIVQSSEFDAWVKSLPGYARSAVAAVLDPEKGGTAAEVNEIFDTFKAQTGKTSAPGAKRDTKAPEVQRRVPASLSEAAGEQHQDITQQVMASAGTNPNALIERMQDMSPEQVDRLLNSI